MAHLGKEKGEGGKRRKEGEALAPGPEPGGMG